MKSRNIPHTDWKLVDKPPVGTPVGETGKVIAGRIYFFDEGQKIVWPTYVERRNFREVSRVDEITPGELRNLRISLGLYKDGKEKLKADLKAVEERIEKIKREIEMFQNGLKVAREERAQIKRKLAAQTHVRPPIKEGTKEK